MTSCWCYCRICFVFNETATTEIDTYGHTLSLHDALPIYIHVLVRRRSRGIKRLVGRDAAVQRRSSEKCYVVRAGPRERSEEHTSELQSLMRSSYAVFCLKKKLETLDNINTDTYANIYDDHYILSTHR